MARVIGIDPGTLSIDVCGLDEGRVFLDRSFPTADALHDPSRFVGQLRAAAPIDLIVGPSGYGLPLRAARDLSENDVLLAFLARAGETGGIGGLRGLLRAMTQAGLPVVVTPGVIHLETVPRHRKINRVDMGTADKVCAAALAIHELAARRGCREDEVSFVLLELGGAFTSALAVQCGRIVDGIGGTSGPMGARAAGALDGEVAYLAGAVSKQMLFEGGAASVAGRRDALLDGATAGATADTTAAEALAREAYLEGAVKAVAALAVAVESRPLDVVLSGRLAQAGAVREELPKRLGRIGEGATVHVLDGFARIAKHAAQGAALLADGLAGGRLAGLVASLGIREAKGTALDHLSVITPDAARARLGIA